MATPAQFVEQKALNDQEYARNRRDELADEQRKVTLNTLMEDADTPQDKVAAIQAVYHQDPGVLKQHVENLTRKITGQPPAPPAYAAPSVTTQAPPIQVNGQALPAAAPVTVTGPAPRTQQEAIAGIAARGTTPAQRASNLEQMKEQAALRLAQVKQNAPRQDLKLYKGPNGETAYLNAADPNAIPQGFQPVVPGSNTPRPDVKPLEAGGVPYGVQSADGKTYLASQMNDPNTPADVKETWNTLQSALTKKQQEADKRQAEIESRFNRSLADRGTWNVVEGDNGETKLLNSKTGEMRDAPSGLHKSGYYAKQIAPLDAANLNIDTYMQSGSFDGPGDLALQHEFFTATQPSTGFRMTKVQQDILQDSQNWVNSLKGKTYHVLHGTWFSPTQRQQIAKAAQDAIDAKKKTLQGSTGSPAPKKSTTSSVDDDIVKALSGGR